MRSGFRRYNLARLVFLLALAVSQAVARADDRREMAVAPGVRFIEMRRTAPTGRPWAIYVLQVERGRKDILFRSTKGKGQVLGNEPMRAQSARSAAPGAAVVAAVNGDFYRTDAAFLGLPTGLQLLDGELLTSPGADRPVFGTDAEGRPRLGYASLSGSLAAGGEMLTITSVNKVLGANDLVLYTPRFGSTTREQPSFTAVELNSLSPALPPRPGVSYAATVATVRREATEAAIPDGGVLLAGRGTGAAALAKLTPGLRVAFTVGLVPDWNDVRDAVSGWPLLVRGGKQQIEKASDAAIRALHPRTAVGFNDQWLYFVAVDGRQPGYSMGMSLSELADLMLELGCTEAANLDGGGSTTLVVRGAVMNRPSDGVDRSVSNGWAILSTAAPGPLHRLRVWPENPSVLTGSSLLFQATGEDEFGAPVPVAAGELAWKVNTALGTVDEKGVFTAGPAPRAGLLTASVGTLSASTTVNVWGAPATLALAPAQATLAPGESISLRLLATDGAGRPLAVNAGAARWSASGGGASVDAEGRVTANAPGTVRVTAAIGELSATAQLVVQQPQDPPAP